MKICFVETEPADTAYFEQMLGEHTLSFVDSLADVPGDTEILSVFIASRIDDAFLAEHHRIKLIASRSTTLDHIDLEACARRGVAVAHVPTYGDHIVAEHTFALLLAVARRLREAMRLPRQGPFSYEALRGIELCGKTFGIVGTGRIGMRTIPIAHSFGMRVLAHDIQPRPADALALGFHYVSMDELLRRSHVISLHAPLTAETFHMLDRDAFAKCRRGVIVINTARGRLIDSGALLEALEAGIVGGAGLDVLGEEAVFRRDAGRVLTDQIVARLHSGEAQRQHPGNGLVRTGQIEKLICLGKLLARPDVVFTPHTGFNCVESLQRINAATLANIHRFIEGRLPASPAGSSLQAHAADEVCLAAQTDTKCFKSGRASVRRAAS